MTQQATILFDRDEALAIIMAFEFISANPEIKMKVDGISYDISHKYLAEIQPIQDKLVHFFRENNAETSL
jgi:hypothetical protein